MSNGDNIIPGFANPCSAPTQMMELATAFCLSPMLDSGEVSDPDAVLLQQDIQGLKEHLQILFSDGMRQEILKFIKRLDENRDLYRRTLLLWLDMIEEVAYEAELDLGDETGPVKLKRVRGAIFYLLTKFSEDVHVANIPRFLNRLAVSMVIRGSVEFIITLVNVDKYKPATRSLDLQEIGLWSRTINEKRATQDRKVSPVRERGKRILSSVERQRELWRNRIANFLLDWWLAPPAVPPEFRVKVDSIVDQMRQQSPDGMPPVNMMGQGFFEVVIWIGEHGKELRAAIDAFAIVVHQTELMSELTRERRIEVIQNALILYFDELGLNGPYFRFVLRLLIDVNLDAMIFLYRKRNLLQDAT